MENDDQYCEVHKLHCFFIELIENVVYDHALTDILDDHSVAQEQINLDLSVWI